MPDSSDPYTYPGTNVLRNIPDIRDFETLAVFEATATFARLAELNISPLNGRFDVAHLHAIHKYVFQDVFRWAGEFRTVNISKGGHFFGAAAFVQPAVEGVLQKLPAENYLRKLEPVQFAVRAGYYLGEINAVHPFREGNGRTQREFIRALGVQAGYLIDWGRIGREEMIDASRDSFRTGISSGLAALIQRCVSC
jgi:cell filamentation protein